MRSVTGMLSAVDHGRLQAEFRLGVAAGHALEQLQPGRHRATVGRLAERQKRLFRSIRVASEAARAGETIR
jgi:hypothetical protein